MDLKEEEEEEESRWRVTAREMVKRGEPEFAVVEKHFIVVLFAILSDGSAHSLVK